jgi:hypothetical protein
MAVQSIVRDEPISDGLSGRGLAKRLDVDRTGFQGKRDNPEKLASYTRDRDPDGIAWEFRDGKYYPIAQQ